MLLNGVYAAEVCGIIEADNANSGTYTAKVLFYNRGRAIPVNFFISNASDKVNDRVSVSVSEFLVGGFGQGLTGPHARF